MESCSGEGNAATAVGESQPTRWQGSLYSFFYRNAVPVQRLFNTPQFGPKSPFQASGTTSLPSSMLSFFCAKSHPPDRTLVSFRQRFARGTYQGNSAQPPSELQIRVTSEDEALCENEGALNMLRFVNTFDKGFQLAWNNKPDARIHLRELLEDLVHALVAD